MNDIRIGIIGSGGMASHHAQSFSQTDARTAINAALIGLAAERSIEENRRIPLSELL